MMKASILKRLEKVEKSLALDNRAVVLTGAWSDLNEEERESRLARWRGGEDFEGVQSDVSNRRNAMVIMLVGLKPK